MKRARVLAGLCGGAFILLTLTLTLVPHALAFLDVFAANRVRLFQSLSWSLLFLALTSFGSAAGVVLVALASMFFLRQHPGVFERLLIGLLGSSLSVALLKDFADRARPTVLSWITPVDSFSYPSGHATSAMMLYGALGIYAYRRSHTRLEKIVSVGLPALVIVFVGLSRIVLGFHFFTDVLGGYLLGGFWLALVFAVPLTLRRRSAIPSS